MTKVPQQPGPGRSTSEAAFNEVKRSVAERNEQVQREARKVRTARERKETARRRALDLL